jgi:hypothetical protein
MHYGGDGRRSKSIWAHEPILTPEPEPMECGGSLALCPEGPPLFFPLQAQASPGSVGLQAEKRELRSRTPQNAATPQAQVRT